MDLHAAPDPRAGNGAVVALALLCPAVPLVVGLASPYRSPLVFLTTLVPVVLLSLFLLVRVGRWLRPTVAARPLDHLVALVPIAAVGATLLVVLGAAERFGIRGSAVPRIGQGIAMSPDVPYVSSAIACVVALGVAVVLLVLLLLSRLRVRGAPETAHPPGTVRP